MGIADLLRQKVEKQLAALDEKLEAAEAEAKARKAHAESQAADAELEQELLVKVNDLKEKMIQGQKYLEDLADAGDERAERLKANIAKFFD